MTHGYRCWAEVDLDALRENLSWIRHRVGPSVSVMTVVKADAYGHGLKQIAALLMQSGTDIFGVANLSEARAIRSVGRGWPILMLGACLPDEIEIAVKDDVMPTISSMDEVNAFAATARRLEKRVSVHVKVNTGMGRLGAEPTEVLEILEAIKAEPSLNAAGLFTHYSSAEDDAEFSRQQRDCVSEVISTLQRHGLPLPPLHANNSAGILHEPESMFQIVRPGLLVYGIVPRGERMEGDAQLQTMLRPALALRCRVSFVKQVEANVPISYGHTFVTPRPMKIATVSAGYADGFPRAASSKASVIIRGRKCAVVGRVTMDQTMVDVTDLAQIEPGDEVTLIGRAGDAVIHAAELAATCGTIAYEILTNITYRVPRVYRGGQAS